MQDMQNTNNSNYFTEYKRTRRGFVAVCYNRHVQRSRVKGWERPTYTLEELRNWSDNNAIFDDLFNSWVESDYNKLLVPSYDRINPRLPYCLTNLQLMTWAENNEKGKLERSKAKGRKLNKKNVIKGTNLETLEVTEFRTYREAERITGQNTATIARSINNKKPSRKYLWEKL